MPFRFWRRRWWFESAHRWQVVGAFAIAAGSAAIGARANSDLSHRLVDQQAVDVAAIEQVVVTLCNELKTDRVGFRLFVSDLLEGASTATRDRVFERLDARQPEERVCGDTLAVPEPAPALPTTTSPTGSTTTTFP